MAGVGQNLKLGPIRDRWNGPDAALAAGLEVHRARINDIYDALNPMAPGNAPNNSASVIVLNANGELGIFRGNGIITAFTSDQVDPGNL